MSDESFFAKTIAEQKYCHDKADGTKESWSQVAERVATCVTKPYLPEITEYIRERIERKEMLPGGRWLANSGRKYPQVNNCALFDVEDSRQDWAMLMNNIVNTLTTGMGIGVVYSKLRGEGAYISGMGGKSSGPLSLMQMVNECGRHIMAGGSRRCLEENALVHTKIGLKKIKDIEIGQLVLTGDGSYHKVLAKLDQGIQNTVKIKTQLGEFVCTPNHRMAVLANIYGEYYWKEAKDLISADRLLFVTKTIPGHKTRLPKDDNSECEHWRTKQITIPDLDTEIAWFLGFLHGDGCVHYEFKNIPNKANRITINTHITEYSECKRLIKAIKKFGIKAKIKQGHGNCWSVSADSLLLTKYLLKFKQSKVPMTIPMCILEGTPDIRAAYLAGVLDSDGCISKTIRACCSIYKSYILQVQNLLASLGIASRLKLDRPAYENRKDAFRLTISDVGQIDKYIQTIGPYSCKQSRLKKAKIFQSHHTYSAPANMLNIDDKCWQKTTYNQKAVYYRNGNIPIDSINKSHGFPALLPITVENVSANIAIQTYDIEVAGRNEFVVSGLLVHNSAIWSGLHHDHPDIDKYIDIKNWPIEIKKLKAKDFNFPATLDMTNISVILDDNFFTAYNDTDHPKHKRAHEIYWKTVRNMMIAGEPGFSIDVGENAGEHLRNAPVAGETRVLTDTGYQKVIDIVDKPVTVWTGWSWAKDVSFKLTGVKQPIIKISLSNGNYIRCEPNHEFIAVDSDKDIPACELNISTKLMEKLPDKAFFNIVNITAVAKDGYDDVYCADVKQPEHSFMAEGVIVKNCTEIVSRDNGDVCNLASINIAKINHIDQFAEAVWNTIGFMLCGTIYGKLPLDIMHTIRDKNRRLGLGLMGLHEWLLVRGYKYGPNQELGQWLQIYKDTSDSAAKYWANKLGIVIPIKKRALAPNGSIGIVADTTTCLEPVFAVAIKRRYMKNKNWVFQYIIDGAAERIIARGVDPALIEDAYTLAEDIERRIAFQAWIQSNYVDNSISSTLNVPRWGSSINNESTVKSFGNTLMKYLPQLRGITTYPDGSRGGQPLTRVSYQEAVKHLGKEYIESGHGQEELTNDRACVNGVCGI